MVHNSQIIQVCGSWFCRTNVKRPKWTTPTVSAVSDRRSICHKRESRRPLLKRCPKAGLGLERGKMWVESICLVHQLLTRTTTGQTIIEFINKCVRADK